MAVAPLLPVLAPAAKPPVIEQSQQPAGSAGEAGPEADAGHPDPGIRTSILDDGPGQQSEHGALQEHQEESGCLQGWHWLLRVLFAPKTSRDWLWFIFLWGAVGGLVIWFAVWAFPRIVDSAFDPAVAAIDASLTRVQIGVVVSLAVMILPITIVLTKEPFVWLASVLFSFPEAFAMVEAGHIPGMAIPFFLARRWVRKPLLRFLHRYRYTKAVLLGVRKAGPFLTTIILRLGPVPGPLINYMMGVPPTEGVRWFFGQYMVASIIGSLPEVLLGVIFGRNIKGLSAMLQGEKIPTSQMIYNLVSLGAAILLVVGGYIYARRALGQLELEAAAEEALRDPVIEQVVHPPGAPTQGPRGWVLPPHIPYQTLTTPEATYLVIQSIALPAPPPLLDSIPGSMGPGNDGLQAGNPGAVTADYLPAPPRSGSSLLPPISGVAGSQAVSQEQEQGPGYSAHNVSSQYTTIHQAASVTPGSGTLQQQQEQCSSEPGVAVLEQVALTSKLSAGSVAQQERVASSGRTAPAGFDHVITDAAQEPSVLETPLHQRFSLPSQPEDPGTFK